MCCVVVYSDRVRFFPWLVQWLQVNVALGLIQTSVPQHSTEQFCPFYHPTFAGDFAKGTAVFHETGAPEIYRQAIFLVTAEMLS